MDLSSPTRRAMVQPATGLLERIDRLDLQIATLMARYGVLALQLALAIIFVWFGALKPIGLSPAEPLVLATVSWMPLLTPQQWLGVIGVWEVLIGLTFLFRPTLRIAIGLMAVQMVGTMLPLVVLPEVTFQAGRFPYAPTMEGQYIIKNVLIIAAALVVGGTVRSRQRDRGSVAHGGLVLPTETPHPGPRKG